MLKILTLVDVPEEQIEIGSCNHLLILPYLELIDKIQTRLKQDCFK